MRIAIATSGRFHVLDLASRLARLGHDVAFYSYVPRGRAMQFGLPGNAHRSLLMPAAPFLATRWMLRPIGLEAPSPAAINRILDRFASIWLEPCDVLIAMSGVFVKTLQAAKRRYGAKIVLERGSRHILSQVAILQDLTASKSDRSVPSHRDISRELDGYRIADRIAIASQHVEESFCEHGVDRARLFRNPYGVDLQMFRPTTVPSTSRPTFLMTGAWSMQKGCDVLVDAWRRLKGTRLVHVGPVADAPLPNDSDFTHIDAVDQRKLIDHYARANVFCLASRQEGLAMVQAQALACGLPLVCTTRTGGADLREYMDSPDAVYVVPPNDPIQFAQAMERALDFARTQQGTRDVLGRGRDALSWDGYAKRYAAMLDALVA